MHACHRSQCPNPILRRHCTVWWPVVVSVRSGEGSSSPCCCCSMIVGRRGGGGGCPGDHVRGHTWPMGLVEHRHQAQQGNPFVLVKGRPCFFSIRSLLCCSKNALARNRWMVDARQFIQLRLAVRDVQLTDQQDVVSLHGNLAKLAATASPILWQLEQTQMDDGCEGKGAK